MNDDVLSHEVVAITWTLILDPGSWILDAGFCIIALHHLDSTSAECDNLVVISIVVICGTVCTLPHSSHSNNEQCNVQGTRDTAYACVSQS
jgi:hypothetical protein